MNQISPETARLNELAQALIYLQEDMPSADVRNALGEAAHYLQKFAGHAQRPLDDACLARIETALITNDVAYKDMILQQVLVAVALSSTPQSAPLRIGSLPSGESDPSVTLDLGGAGTHSDTSTDGKPK
jgi:hypothetical protein